MTLSSSNKIEKQQPLPRGWIAKLGSIEVLGSLLASVFVAGVTWATITLGQESQNKDIEKNEKKVENVEKKIDGVKNDLIDIQIQNSAMKNEQKNQGENIKQIVIMLQRIEDKIQ